MRMSRIVAVASLFPAEGGSFLWDARIEDKTGMNTDRSGLSWEAAIFDIHKRVSDYFPLLLSSEGDVAILETDREDDSIKVLLLPIHAIPELESTTWVSLCTVNVPNF